MHSTCTTQLTTSYDSYDDFYMNRIQIGKQIPVSLFRKRFIKLFLLLSCRNRNIIDNYSKIILRIVKNIILKTIIN